MYNNLKWLKYELPGIGVLNIPESVWQNDVDWGEVQTKITEWSES